MTARADSGGGSEAAVRYVSTTGNDSSDGSTWARAKLTIPAAISALPASGGIVEVGHGTFNVSSTGRQIVGGLTSGSKVVTDATCTNADVGAAVMGDFIWGGTYIASVNPGVSFTLNQNPNPHTGTANMIVSQPAITLPAGVEIRGRGGSYDDGTVNQDGAYLTNTLIQDNGTGISVLIPSVSDLTANHVTRTTLTNLSVWGNASNLYGLININEAWLLLVQGCDFSNHGRAGVGLSSNQNNNLFLNSRFSNNGSASATIPTGAVLTSLFNSNPSASITFDNCMFFDNYGAGIAAGGLSGVFAASHAVSLIECTFNDVFTNATTGRNGFGAWLGSSTSGISRIYGGFMGTPQGAGFYNLVTDGAVICTGAWFGSNGPAFNFSIRVNSSGLTLNGCTFAGASISSIDDGNGSTFNWTGCKTTDPLWTALRALPVAYAGGIGTTATFTTQPAAPTSVALSSGTAWQNTTGSDVILAIPVSYAANGDSLAVARGSTSTPTAIGTVTRRAGDTDVLEYYVPATWYFKATLGATATFTANATAQPV